MNPPLVDLTVEICSADGNSAEFYQAEEERIAEALRSLATPRLLGQSHLVLASEHGASMIPCRGIDLLRARTSAPTPLSFPLTLPAGLLDIVETAADCPDSPVAEAPPEPEPGTAPPLTSQVEIHTLGGWRVTLKAVARAHGSVHDERQLFAHLLTLPAIPFRLEAGGFGLINPANLTRLSARPRPSVLPGHALPLALLRGTPAR